MRRIIAVLAAVSMLIPAGAAAPQNQGPKINKSPERNLPGARGEQDDSGAVTIRSSVDLVLIDARVTGKSGKPILGLKPEQFSLTEDGNPQKISSLDYNNIEAIEKADVQNARPIVVPMGTVPAPKPETIRAAVRDHRLIVIFFDLTALHPDDLLRAQEGAERYVREQMSPADLVALAVFGNQLRVPVHFTNDRDVLMRAIQKLRAGKDANLADMADAVAQPGEDTTSEDTGAAFTADETEFNIFNTDRKLAALQSLSVLLRDIPGRKSGSSSLAASRKPEKKIVRSFLRPPTPRTVRTYLSTRWTREVSSPCLLVVRRGWDRPRARQCSLGGKAHNRPSSQPRYLQRFRSVSRERYPAQLSRDTFHTCGRHRWPLVF